MAEKPKRYDARKITSPLNQRLGTPSNMGRFGVRGKEEINDLVRAVKLEAQGHIKKAQKQGKAMANQRTANTGVSTLARKAAGRPARSAEELAQIAASAAEAKEKAKSEAQLARDARMAIAWGGDGDEFKGDAYELLSIAYKSPLFSPKVRIECAMVCIRYERPMLQAIMVEQGNGGSALVHEMMGLLNGTGRGIPKRRGDIEGSAEEIEEPALEAE